ncbi:MAG: histidinol-phosphatase [Balneolales bacterium]|nr:histidinol-phosphatase [Balneolales bacterium]
MVDSLHEAAIKAAKIAGEVTLKYFRKNVEVISKDDDSPVTIADREAEQAMRAFIMETFPEHGIIGEEFGTHQPDAEIKWILDPIDGTVGFIHGIPLYTNLIGITIGGKPTVGVIHAPFMEELVAGAEGIPAHLNGVTTKVRNCTDLSKASMMTSDVQYFRTYGYRNSFEHLLDQVGTHRTYGDAYGHLMVATGRADIMMDPVLNLWDAAALLPVIEQAGGSFTDLSGTARIDGGNGFSCAPALKNELLHIFKNHQ